MIVNRYLYLDSKVVDTENDYFNVLLPLKDIVECYTTGDFKKSMCLLWNQDEEGYKKATKVLGTMTGSLLTTSSDSAVEVSSAKGVI